MREACPGTCPACGADIQIVHHRIDIPHFPDLLLVTIACDACGYRHTDTIIPGEREPARWMVRIEEPGDLSTRVVRSTTGTIRIPELGLAVEPGTACEGFVTNVEGVLSRFERAVAIIEGLRGDEVERLLLAELARSPLFGLRFRENAGRALLLPRDRQIGRAHV